jgi:hypothetical protein
MPLGASQNPAAQDLTITPAGPGWVQAQYTVPSSGQKIALKFQVVSGKAAWRIKDIVYSSGPSLRNLLLSGAE